MKVRKKVIIEEIKKTNDKIIMTSQVDDYYSRFHFERQN